ncbi:MAG: hypothetical protein ACLR79_15680, partial [Waltera sp.]
GTHGGVRGRRLVTASYSIAFHVASTKHPERSSGKAISFDCNIPKSAEKVNKTQYNSRVG